MSIDDWQVPDQFILFVTLSYFFVTSFDEYAINHLSNEYLIPYHIDHLHMYLSYSTIGSCEYWLYWNPY